MLSSDKLLEKTNATSSKLLNPIVTERTGTQIILEEKPFMCAVCLKTFKQRTGIKNHIIHNKHILYVPNKTIPENLGIALPKKWKYESYKLGVNDSSLTFLVCNVHTKEDAVIWLKSYMEENKCKFVSACDRSLKTGKQLRYLCEHWRDGIKNHKNKIKGTGCKCAITFNLSGCSFELFICIKKSSCLILCKNLSTTVALSSLIARLRSFHIQLF